MDENNELVGEAHEEKGEEKRISKWTRIAEFEGGKKITPLSFEYIDGSTIKAKPEFCDADGKIYVMTYIDHMNMEIERRFESQYPSLWNSAKYQKVERNKKYKLSYGPIKDKSFKGFTWESVS